MEVLSVFVVQELFLVAALMFLSSFTRWWGYKVLQRIPDKDHDEVMLKSAAYDCLGGKRKNWALNTHWHGNYLAKVTN